MHLNATRNEYQQSIPDFDSIPKAVLGAIAFSFALQMTGCEDFYRAAAMIREEWQALYTNGVVPQKPK